MKKIRSNKKGQEELVMVFAVFAVLIILVLFIGFKDRQREQSAKELLETIDDQAFFVSYLRTPVTVSIDDYNVYTISDLISYSHSKGEYDLLEEKTSESLQQYFGREVCWKMKIAEKEIEEDDECLGRKIAIDLPIPQIYQDNKQPIDVKLEIW